VSEPPSSPPSIEDHAARRMPQLAEENRQLRHYVTEVMTRLRENERLFSRLFELETAVLQSTDPEDMCFSLLRNLRARFDLDMVRFWFERSSFIGSCRMEAVSERDLVWLEEDEIAKMGLPGRHVWLMRLSPEKGFSWLSPADHHLGSMALLVLGDISHPFGILGLGSIDPERFQPGHGTDFLQHLAQVVGLSLENVVSRERLARLAMTDKLTGVRNRRFLQPHSNQPLSQWFGKDVGVACLYIDVDGLAAVNAASGRETGDEILTAVSHQTYRLVRMQDPLIRMEDDEFALLLPGCWPDKARHIAEQLIGICNSIEAGDGHVSISIGLAYSAPEEDLRVKDLIARADQAMYVAKALGGGRFEETDGE